MKKIFTIICLIIAMVVAMSSCKKMESPVEYATVTFGYQMVESNSMVATKSISRTDILELINSSLPTTFSVVLTDKVNGTKYTVNIGTPITLPLGEYTTTYERNGVYVAGVTPTFIINDNSIKISKDVTSYTLNAEYTQTIGKTDNDKINTPKDEIKRRSFGMDMSKMRKMLFSIYKHVFIL